MPNRWTFTIKPIRELLARELSGNWCDPFAGNNSPAGLRNDIEENTEAENHLDALVFLQGLADSKFDGVLYDPPYSLTQARMYGKKEFANMGYWAKVKDQIARVTRPGGKVISFGWSTNGLGKGRGFDLKEILIVPHGGSKNDTLVTVEVKQ